MRGRCLHSERVRAIAGRREWDAARVSSKCSSTLVESRIAAGVLVCWHNAIALAALLLLVAHELDEHVEGVMDLCHALLTTAQGHRAQGLARRAVARLCNSLLRHVDIVGLDVKAHNAAAIRRYAGLGFREVPHQDEFMLEP